MRGPLEHFTPCVINARLTYAFGSLPLSLSRSRAIFAVQPQDLPAAMVYTGDTFEDPSIFALSKAGQEHVKAFFFTNPAMQLRRNSELGSAGHNQGWAPALALAVLAMAMVPLAMRRNNASRVAKVVALLASMFLVGWLVFHEEMGPALLLIRRGTDTDITLTLPERAHPFPRGLANGPAELTAFLDGREALHDEESRPNLLRCGCCMSLETGKRAGPGSRVRKLGKLQTNSFPCDCGVRGEHYCSKANYTDLFFDSKFAFSPAGNGWTNYRDWEAIQFGTVPLLDYHPSFTELYRDMPVVTLKDCNSNALASSGPLVDYCKDPAARGVTDWDEVTPDWLEGEWRRIQAQASKYDMKRLYWPYWFHRLYENSL